MTSVANFWRAVYVPSLAFATQSGAGIVTFTFRVYAGTIGTQAWCNLDLAPTIIISRIC